jgi:hypothetical protein
VDQLPQHSSADIQADTLMVSAAALSFFYLPQQDKFQMCCFVYSLQACGTPEIFEGGCWCEVVAKYSAHC